MTQESRGGGRGWKKSLCGVFGRLRVCWTRDANITTRESKLPLDFLPAELVKFSVSFAGQAAGVWAAASPNQVKLSLDKPYRGDYLSTFICAQQTFL